jgi:hypothetical protein
MPFNRNRTEKGTIQIVGPCILKNATRLHPKVALHWAPFGKRKPGRRRTTWRRTILSKKQFSITTARGSGQNEVERTGSGFMFHWGIVKVSKRSYIVHRNSDPRYGNEDLWGRRSSWLTRKSDLVDVIFSTLGYVKTSLVRKFVLVMHTKLEQLLLFFI